MNTFQNTRTQLISSSKIACDGDKESPHPRVYLKVGRQDFVDCPYCGKHFVLDAAAQAHHEH